MDAEEHKTYSDVYSVSLVTVTLSIETAPDAMLPMHVATSVAHAELALQREDGGLATSQMETQSIDFCMPQ